MPYTNCGGSISLDHKMVAMKEKVKPSVDGMLAQYFFPEKLVSEFILCLLLENTSFKVKSVNITSFF